MKTFAEIVAEAREHIKELFPWDVEEKMKQALALGMIFGRLSNYINNTILIHEINLSVLAEGNDGEELGFELFGSAMKRLKDLNIAFDITTRKNCGDKTRADNIVIKTITPTQNTL